MIAALLPTPTSRRRGMYECATGWSKTNEKPLCIRLLFVCTENHPALNISYKDFCHNKLERRMHCPCTPFRRNYHGDEVQISFFPSSLSGSISLCRSINVKIRCAAIFAFSRSIAPWKAMVRPYMEKKSPQRLMR